MPSRRIPHKPPMDALRLAVFQRDGFRCFAWRVDPDHKCRNTWGEEVSPTVDEVRYVNALTLEHVRLEPGGARRDDERFCATLCHGANAEEHWGSTTVNRRKLNAHLDELYPDRRRLFT